MASEVAGSGVVSAPSSDPGCCGPTASSQAPERSPRGHSFFFARDFDGNLIELMDLGYMYHVLNWLGPLGGWIFRRGMYKKYYE